MKIYYPTAKNCDKNAKLKDYHDLYFRADVLFIF